MDINLGGDLRTTGHPFGMESAHQINSYRRSQGLALDIFMLCSQGLALDIFMFCWTRLPFQYFHAMVWV